MLFHWQLKIGARENGDHVSGPETLIVGRRWMIERSAEVERDQIRAQIVLVQTFDERIFPCLLYTSRCV